MFENGYYVLNFYSGGSCVESHPIEIDNPKDHSANTDKSCIVWQNCLECFEAKTKVRRIFHGQWSMRKVDQETFKKLI